MVETRRRSARIKSQSDDESISSSVSSARATRSRARGLSGPTAAAVANAGTPKKTNPANERPRSNSSASKASLDTPTRRTRSRTKSDVSEVKPDAPKRELKKKQGDVEKSTLEAIPEVVETEVKESPEKPTVSEDKDRQSSGVTKTAGKTMDNVVETPKSTKKSAKKARKSSGADEVKVDAQEAVGVIADLEAPKSTKKSAKTARKSSGADQLMVDAQEAVGVIADLEAPKSTKKSSKKARKSSGADQHMVDAQEAVGVIADVEAPKSTKKSAKKTRKPSGADQLMVDAQEAVGVIADVEAPKSTQKSSKKARKSSGADEAATPTPQRSAKKETPAKTPQASLAQKAGTPAQSKSTQEPSTKKKKNKKRKSMELTTPVKTITADKPKKQPILDTTVHRLRFLKLAPKSILAMASGPSYKTKHLPQPQQQGQHQPYFQKPPQLIAISRQGGSVELVDPAERWLAVGHVPGVREREVDALVWVCGATAEDNESTTASNDNFVTIQSPRLIGASRDGTIFHLDFISQRQTQVVGSGAGGVFCLVSLCSKGSCRSNSGCNGYFAAGCEDGSIKIYRLRNGIELVATLPSVGNAVLSLAWAGNPNGKDALGGSVIFAGVADGTIRRFDCVASVTTGSISTGLVLCTGDGSERSSTTLVHRWKSTLRMVVENRGLREATKVWALQALSDGTTVVSGDSLGNVQFWDGKFGTMLQTFSQSESGADVLCLAVSEDENKVFASGVDSRVMCIQRQGLASEDTANANPDAAPVRRWINVCAHRKHTHDVRALVTCHKKATGSKKEMEFLVSGSIDTRLCTYVTSDFKSSRPRIWFNWPSLSPISLSREHRLIAVTRSDRIDIYRLDVANHVQDTENKDESKCIIKTISIKSPFNLNCSTISDDGKFLAASDATTLYVFSLNMQQKDGSIDLDPKKIPLPKDCRRPCTALRFDSVQRLICATVGGPINILQLSPNDDDEPSCSVSLERTFQDYPSGVKYAFIGLDVSLDGKWFAASRFSRDKGSVHVFSLEPFGHWWSLPKVESTATCIRFLGEASLAVGCSNNSFYIFNLNRRELSNWSHDMGLHIVKSLPKELSSRPEPLTRILTIPSSHQKLVLGAHGFFCIVDLDKPVPDNALTYPPDSLRATRSIFHDEDDLHLPPPSKKQKKGSNDSNDNFTTCLRYSNVLFQTFLSEREMVIVEEPWRSVLEELPAALSRRIYGS